MAHVFRAPLDRTFLVYISVAALFLLFSLTRRKTSFTQLVALGRGDLPILVFILLFAFFTMMVGSWHNQVSDTVHHIAYIRKYFASNVVDTSNIVLSDSLPYDILFGVYSYNAVFPLYASVAQITNVDPIPMFLRSTGGISLLMLSAMYCLGVRIGGTRRVGAMACMCLLAYWMFRYPSFGYGVFQFKSLPYPNHVGAIVFTTAAALLFDQLFSNKYVSSIIVIAVVCGTLPLLHVQWSAYAMYFLFICVVFALVTGSKVAVHRASLALALTGVLMLLPWSLKFSSYSSQIDQLDTLLFDQNLMLRAWSLDFLNPLVVFRSASKVFIAVAVFWLVYSVKRKAHGSTLFTPSVLAALVIMAIAFVVITPPFATLLIYLASPNIIARMTWMLDIVGCALTGHVLVMATLRAAPSAVRFENFPDRIARFVTLELVFAGIIVAVSLGYAGSAYHRFWVTRHDSRFEPSLSQVLAAPSLDRLLRSVPDGASIISFGRPGKALEAAFANVLMARPSYDLTPTAKAWHKRFDAILEAPTDIESMRALGRVPGDHIFLWPAAQETGIARLTAHSEVFRRLGDVTIDFTRAKKQRFTLFAVDRESFQRLYGEITEWIDQSDEVHRTRHSADNGRFK